jgi:hypothetical protein
MKLVILGAILIFVSNGMALMNDLMVMILIDNDRQRDQKAREEVIEDTPPVTLSEQVTGMNTTVGNRNTTRTSAQEQPST